MQRLHPIHVVTLLLAALAAVFAFVAMWVAFDARDAAETAAPQGGRDDAHSIWVLQDALVRAGVIEDPHVVPDDRGEPDGPWARCLTEAERDELEADGMAAAAPSEPCETVHVEAVECDLAVEEPAPDEDVAMQCELLYVIDGGRHTLSGPIRPDDVAAATSWFNVEGAPEIDRFARGEDGRTYVHVVDRDGLHGWFATFPADW